MSNDANRDSIIEKIKKLLAMTERSGCTQAEAIQAALMAQKLIAEHNVSASEMSESTCEPIEEISGEYFKGGQSWALILASVVAAAFRCKYYRRKEAGARYYYAVFVGHKSDASAASLVYSNLYNTCVKLSRAHASAERKTVRKQMRDEGYPEWYVKDYAGRVGREAEKSFSYGFMMGAKTELEKQTEALMLIVPADVEEAYEAKNLKKARRIRTPDYMSAQSYDNGLNAGRDAVRAGRIGESNTYALNA